MPDPERIAARLQALWDLARGPGGGADRPAYSPAEAQAMRLVAGWAGELGLDPALDEHGNLWALPAGWDGPVVTAGSHVDTVPDGGRWDGALGTVLGLELAADLADLADLADPAGAGAGAAGARAGVLVCAAEEAPRFGAGTIGSRLLTGRLAHSDLAALTDAAGTTAADALAAYLDQAGLPRRPAPDPRRLLAHAEVHVALRPQLRRLGVVGRVAAPHRFTVTVTGAAGHAGEVAMEDRRDALAAGAQLILAVEAAARAEPPETVATVGTVAVAPGAVSVIPAQSRLGIDVRGIEAASLARVRDAIVDAAREIERARGVRVDVEPTRGGEPVTMDPELVAAALAAARGLGFDAGETWSGSGHDAQHLSALVPSLLLFVPLHGGAGHTPQEGAEMAEVLQAAEVAGAVLRERAAGAAPA